MTNRPKSIGTATETAVVRVMHANGFPQAERRALHGNLDLGDILVCPGVIAEVKGGDMARTASDNLVDAWRGETIRELGNAGADIGILVWARSGIGAANAGRWWTEFVGAAPREVLPGRYRLDDALHLLRLWGYGDAL